MPIIDVFIAFTQFESNIGNLRKESKFPPPDWNETKKFAAGRGAILNVYDVDSGTCNKHTFLRSLKTPGRVVVFAGHSWQDGRMRNGRTEAGGGIKIREGQAFGTFGVTQAMQDSSGRVYGDYSPIPIIRAARVFIFSCNPGADFRSILRNHLVRGSVGYYVNAGMDNLVWLPIIESAAHVAVLQLVSHQESQAVKDANAVLQYKNNEYVNGDHLQYVWGTR